LCITYSATSIPLRPQQTIPVPYTTLFRSPEPAGTASTRRTAGFVRPPSGRRFPGLLAPASDSTDPEAKGASDREPFPALACPDFLSSIPPPGKSAPLPGRRALLHSILSLAHKVGQTPPLRRNGGFPLRRPDGRRSGPAPGPSLPRSAAVRGVPATALQSGSADNGNGSSEAPHPPFPQSAPQPSASPAPPEI